MRNDESDSPPLVSAPSEQRSTSIFPATHWSLIGRAGDDNSKVRRIAIVDVVREYLPALRSFLRTTRRVPPDDVEDLLQSFLADKVLGEGLIPKADRTKGRFRTFLLAALNHFLLNRVVHDCRLRRRPRNGVLSLGTVGDDSDCPNNREVFDVAGTAPEPSAAFDVMWARHVLRRAVERTEAECRQAGRVDIWTILDERVLRPALDGAEPVPYEQLLGRAGVSGAGGATSPAGLANLLVTAKRMLARNLRGVIGEYETDPAAVEEEIRDLRAILGGARG
jgi:RNA polymerase sigma-70 factor (ECF subfamily)